MRTTPACPSVGTRFAVRCCDGTEHEFESGPPMNTVVEVIDDRAFRSHRDGNHPSNLSTWKWQKKRGAFVRRMGPFEDQHYDRALLP